MPPKLPHQWSIGIYKGQSPLELSAWEEATNPILTGADVKDIPATFVADPFMIPHQNRWYLFTETVNATNNIGEIGMASSDDGKHWQYEQSVLVEPFHLSYPYVFESEGTIWMMPETIRGEAVSLYRATKFPYQWELVKKILPGRWSDPSIFFHDGKWWLYVCPWATRHRFLELYYADELLGEWKAHPANPLIAEDNRFARPGGRVIKYADKWYRFAQNCVPYYGINVHAFEIEEISTNTYREKPYVGNPILQGSGEGWNASLMHHIDAHQLGENDWIACVDGHLREPEYAMFENI